MYSIGLVSPNRQASRDAPIPTKEEVAKIADIVEAQTKGGKEDAMLLQKRNGKLLAESFGLPEMEIEIERAVEQVERDIKAEPKLKEEKEELQNAIAKQASAVKVEEIKR